ncbi:MAG: peptide deformylase [Leptolyngbya sp. SIO3F4]|nr:peptide deformylase [Leptolyngbya sp. SIO3F4]
MTEILSVIELGDKRLRSHAQPIQCIDDQQLQCLIDNLLSTAVAKNGVGIAAPQVAKDLQLFIVASRPNPRYPQAPMMEPTAILNPSLLSHSDEQVLGWEGCLSVPGQRGLVARYREIEVTYFDRHGNEHHKYLNDFVARIFQHEYDHLHGKVFLDRVPNPIDIVTEAEYQKRFG